MSKVTTKLQVTVPKAIADRYGIRPGSEIEWIAAGETLRVSTEARPKSTDIDERLRLFDAATARQNRRQGKKKGTTARQRGWAREDLYEARGLSR